MKPTSEVMEEYRNLSDNDKTAIWKVACDICKGYIGHPMEKDTVPPECIAKAMGYSVAHSQMEGLKESYFWSKEK